MKNKIFSLIALFGLSFATFAQTNTPVIPVNTVPVAVDNSTVITNVLTENTSEEAADVTDTKDTKRKSWSDRNLAGKILIIVGGTVFVVLCVLFGTVSVG